MDDQRQRASNSVQLLFNTLALGVAAGIAFNDPRIVPIIQSIEVELPRHRMPLLQIAEALARPAARAQLTEELNALVFRSCVADAFEVGERYVRRAHKDSLDELPWYWYGKAVRNALRHGFRISLREASFRSRLPLSWRGKQITAADEGRSIEELFDSSDGIQLLLDIRETLSAA